jgi:transcriptional regulator with XRE-family HTH domain
MVSRAEEAFLDKVAKRLADLRRKNGMTQEQLADNSGLDRVAIANIETGVRRPTVTTIYRLAKGMNAKVEDFFKDL